MRQKQNLIEGSDASIINDADLLFYYSQEYVKNSMFLRRKPKCTRRLQGRRKRRRSLRE